MIKYFLFLLIFSTQSLWAQKVIFIVNENNPVKTLTNYEISQLYLKKDRSWADGTPVRFFDRGDNSPERTYFLKKIMKRSSRDLDQYWIGQKLYTGNSAPPQIISDSAIMSMVARFPGAISYVLQQEYQEMKGIKKIEINGRD